MKKFQGIPISDKDVRALSDKRNVYLQKGYLCSGIYKSNGAGKLFVFEILFA